jgi:hypothetical protein
MKSFIGTALTGLVALGASAVASAQQAQTSAPAMSVEEREKATNQALLKTLIERRALVAEAAMPAAGKQVALDFLDSRIAELKKRLN